MSVVFAWLVVVFFGIVAWGFWRFENRLRKLEEDDRETISRVIALQNRADNLEAVRVKSTAKKSRKKTDFKPSDN